jgi:hypothetical protein
MADSQYRDPHQRQMRVLLGEVHWSSVVLKKYLVSSLAPWEVLIDDLLDPT